MSELKRAIHPGGDGGITSNQAQAAQTFPCLPCLSLISAHVKPRIVKNASADQPKRSPAALCPTLVDAYSQPQWWPYRLLRTGRPDRALKPLKFLHFMLGLLSLALLPVHARQPEMRLRGERASLLQFDHPHPYFLSSLGITA